MNRSARVTLSLLFTFLLSGAGPLPSRANDFPPPFSIVSGTVPSNQTWSGKVIVIGDVRIPPGTTVTVLPGTWLIFNDFDATASGNLPGKPELVVDGILKTIGSPSSPVEVLNIHDQKVEQFLKTAVTGKTMTVSPTAIDTEPLRSQWKEHKHQYAILWAIANSLLFLK